MKKITLSMIIMLACVILGGFFYWFQWRPTEIRKKCINSINSQKEFNPEKFAIEYSGKTYFNEAAYKVCLIKNGIEK